MGPCFGPDAGAYRWEQDKRGRPRRFGSSQELGFDVEWLEPPYEWVEGASISGERRFSRGPVSIGGFHAELDDAPGGGTRARATAYVGGSSLLAPAIGLIMERRFRAALGSYFDAIEAALQAHPKEELGTDRPSVVAARNMLARSEGTLLSGVRSQVDQEALDAGERRLRKAVGEQESAQRLVETLGLRPDEEIAQVRPYEAADLWGLSRKEVLHTFLHATRAGLTDLRWQINCPVCRVGAGVAEALKDVRKNVHCQACDVRCDIDFGEHVEAVFQCSASVRKVDTTVFCASSPVFLPHVFAQLR